MERRRESGGREVKILGALTRRSTGFNPGGNNKSSPEAMRRPKWENRSFISQFLKAIAFGLFLSLLIVLIIIVVWITGLEFGQLLSNR
jgi:hypothetical protein